jgi:hypothetical protein
MIWSFKSLAVLAVVGGLAALPVAGLAADKSEAKPEVAAPVAAAALGAPAEGKGQIVFFRPRKLMGAAIGYKVREGEEALGTLSNNHYFIADVAPGAHAYTVHSETKDVLNIEVEAGETYYVMGGMTMGVALYRPNLSPSDKAAFDAVSRKLILAK